EKVPAFKNPYFQMLKRLKCLNVASMDEDHPVYRNEINHPNHISRKRICKVAEEPAFDSSSPQNNFSYAGQQV
ncbi:unnamed protein product, partial [Allacma fusca]